MKTKLLSAVIALQAACILTTVAIQETRLRQGTIVHLETVPVDPRDLLRGDYVILSYKISTLAASLFADGVTNEIPQGAAVFVRLEKRGAFHEAASASLVPLEGDADHPIIRGKVSPSSWWDRSNATNRTIRVDYGLERYYVREGTGNPRGKLTVDAAVPPSGHAIIREVYIDGRPYAEAMKSGSVVEFAGKRRSKRTSTAGPQSSAS